MLYLLLRVLPRLLQLLLLLLLLLLMLQWLLLLLLLLLQPLIRRLQPIVCRLQPSACRLQPEARLLLDPHRAPAAGREAPANRVRVSAPRVAARGTAAAPHLTKLTARHPFLPCALWLRCEWRRRGRREHWWRDGGRRSSGWHLHQEGAHARQARLQLVLLLARGPAGYHPLPVGVLTRRHACARTAVVSRTPHRTS